MQAATILRWFRDTPYGELVREVYWLFSALEIVHFVALCVLFGAVLMFDLRLLGVNRAIPLHVALRFIPVALVAFVLALVSGLGFFCSAPLDYWPNWAFRLKLVLILLAGANALWFDRMEKRSALSQGDAIEPSVATRVAAAISLFAWLCVIVLGRLLPYTGTSQ